MIIEPVDILALLEEKPYAEAELVALFETSRQILTFTLKALKRDGRVKRLASGAWALTTFPVPPAPASVTKPARLLPDLEDEAEDELEAAADAIVDEMGEDVDVDEDLEEEKPLPPQRVNGQKRLYARTADAAGSPLRQVKAERQAVAEDPAWWVGLNREQLAAAIAERAEGMRGTKENLRVPLRILQ